MPKSVAIALICLILLISMPLKAHKLKVFATAEADRIEGEVYFVGGAKATGAHIAITNGKGQTLARLTPDKDGHFSYRATRRMDYRVIADSQDGHQTDWIIKAEELAAGLPLAEVVTVAKPVSGTAIPSQPPETIKGTELPESATVVASVELAVARQVRPLREELAAYGELVRMRDILGGIGYILGIAGLGLWWRSRRRVGKS